MAAGEGPQENVRYAVDELEADSGNAYEQENAGERDGSTGADGK